MEQKKFLPKALALSRKPSQRSVAPCRIHRNLMIQFQENTQADGRTEGQTDPIS